MPKKIQSGVKNSPRKPVQSRGIRTRENIMNTGEKMFMQSGFHSVLADDIAREAGLSVGTFYSYFKDKRNLYLAILKRNSEATVARAAASFSTLFANEKIEVRELIHKTMLISTEMHQKILPMHLEAQQMAVFDAEFDQYLIESDRAVQQMLEHILHRFNPGLDPERLAAISYVLYHASEGIIHHMVSNTIIGIKQEKIIKKATDMFTAFIEHELK